jgi:hypothetical protein
MTADPTIRFGALSQEWERFEALSVSLMPVVSNPDAPISPRSAIPAANKGKVPSMLNGNGEIIGIKGWQTHQLSPEQIATVKAHPDFGFCVVTGRGMIAIDCDVTDAPLADEIKAVLDIALGCDFPVRHRSNSTKFLVPRSSRARSPSG